MHGANIKHKIIICFIVVPPLVLTLWPRLPDHNVGTKAVGTISACMLFMSDNDDVVRRILTGFSKSRKQCPH